MPFTVALTGGIASGKSLVSNEFKRLGVQIIDMDIIAREIVEPGQPGLQEIESVFGSGMIDTNGRLKRTELRSLVFSDPAARKKLESILHPRIRQSAETAVTRVTSSYCILVIPLLHDTKNYPHIGRVLVVDVEPEVQITRLISRDNCTRAQAKQALSSQISREERLKIADDVLDNSGTTHQVRDRVAQLHIKYTELARQRELSD